MKILLFGKNGQVGWELQRSLQPLGEVIALGREDSAENLCGDIGNIDGIRRTIATVEPDIVVNAAAYTAVDKAESETELAHLLNATAPIAMAEATDKLGAWLIHYSTDYVFSGSGDKPWSEEDETAPLCAYGHSKLSGEQGIAKVSSRYIILRTSWVYAARGNNFAKAMLRLAQERESLNVVDDQIGAPTGADLIADVSSHIIRNLCCCSSEHNNLTGIYHLAPAGYTSWCNYACLVLKIAEGAGYKLKVGSNAIGAIPTSDYPTPAPRPLNSRMNTEKLLHTFNLHLPRWEQGVERMLEEVFGNGEW
jgi:dTDP-4-dehydrorhamnose reductase